MAIKASHMLFKFAKSVLILLILLLALPGCTDNASKPSDESKEAASGLQERTSGDSITVEVNSLAPAFAAKLLGGGEARLSDFVGNHVILLEFWSIFCKSCIEEMPKIIALNDKYAKEGLAILSINTDIFTDVRVASVLKKAGIRLDYPILRDTRQSIAADYNVELLPVTVIIDRSGWIRLYQEGYRPGDEERFDSVIRELLAAKKGEDITLAPTGGMTTFTPAGTTHLVTEGGLGATYKTQTLSGKQFLLGGGKPTLLFFWSLYCKPCRAKFPEMVELAMEFPEIQVASVNIDSPHLKRRVESFIDNYPGLPCIPDWSAMGSGDISRAFGVGATPTAIILDGEGEIVYTGQGTEDLGKIKSQLERLR
ncbi:MAG: hypothetical protein C0609_10460 [Deltaproteobacteria bacterium]|nr:MAG: hypothetical protein C0609_10460 [Deltaproteobacteria bacterium]